MNKILELEALRGLVSIYVFLHHTLFSFDLIYKNSLVGKFFSFGQEAVMIFFLLSGYVIALSLEKKHYSFKEYFHHRFLRIYSVVFSAWIVSFISLYLIKGTVDISWYNIFINVIMLQDIEFLKPGVFATPLFGNSPLWSLSYEWWFYMLFYFLYTIYIKNDKHLYVFNAHALIISLIGLFTFKLHYNQISLIGMYYYIWFSGALSLLLINRKLLHKKMILMIISSYMILISIYYFLFVYNQEVISIGIHPVLELRHFIGSLFSLLLAIFFYKFLYKKMVKKMIYNKIINFFSILAPISFGIYVFHYPIKNYFMQYSNFNGYFLLLITFLLTIWISYLVEIKFYKYLRSNI